MGRGGGTSTRSAGRTGARPTAGGAGARDIPRAPVEASFGGDAARRIAESLFGAGVSPNQVAAVAGIAEPGMVATVNVVGGALYVQGRKAGALGDGIYMARSISRTGRGLEIRNELFQVGRSYQGQGIGTRLFASQVRAASAAGARLISTSAARGTSAGYVGYYTWARLGYDAALTGSQRARAARAVGGSPRRVSDLMRTPGGRDWWKAHGTTTNMTFDLRPGSESRRRLGAYLRERRSR